MRVVVDASVAAKWILRQRDGEADVDQALALLRAIQDGSVEVVQPVHWLAEVAAVSARLAPRFTREAIELLTAAELPIHDDPDVYLRACELAVDLDAHVFDTLYHAVALLVAGAELVTADDRYYGKAAALGRIRRLRQLDL